MPEGTPVRVCNILIIISTPPYTPPPQDFIQLTGALLVHDDANDAQVWSPYCNGAWGATAAARLR